MILKLSLVLFSINAYSTVLTFNEVKEVKKNRILCEIEEVISHDECMQEDVSCTPSEMFGTNALFHVCRNISSLSSVVIDSSGSYSAVIYCSSPLKVFKGLSLENSVAILELKEDSADSHKKFLNLTSSEKECSSLVEKTLSLTNDSSLKLDVNFDTHHFEEN